MRISHGVAWVLLPSVIVLATACGSPAARSAGPGSAQNASHHAGSSTPVATTAAVQTTNKTAVSSGTATAAVTSTSKASVSSNVSAKGVSTDVSAKQKTNAQTTVNQLVSIVNQLN